MNFFLQNPTLLASVAGFGALLTEGSYYYYSVKRFPKTHGSFLTEGDCSTLDSFDEKTSTLIDKVLERINLAPVEKTSLTVFLCSGQNPVCKGSLSLRIGAAVGFPKHFTYNSVDDVSVRDLPPSTTYGPPDRNVIAGLKRTLVLSEREKAFSIAKEICRTNHMDPVINVGLQVLFAGSAFFFARYARILLRRRMPLIVKLGIYGAICASQVFMYRYTLAAYQNHAEVSADTAAFQLTPYYAVGGLDYYTKNLERNKLLRQLLGEKGAEVYTSSGNVVAEQVPLTQRKERAASAVEAWENGTLKVAPRVDRGNEQAVSTTGLHFWGDKREVQDEGDSKRL